MPPGPCTPPIPESSAAPFFAASAAVPAASAVITASGTKLTGLLSSKGTLASILSRSSSLTVTWFPATCSPVWFASIRSVVSMHRASGDENTFAFLSIAAPKPSRNTSRTCFVVSLFPRSVRSGSTRSPGVLKSHGMSAASCAWCWSVPHSLCVALPCRMNRNSLRWPLFPMPLLSAAMICDQSTEAPYLGSCCSSGLSSCVSSNRL